MEFYEIKSWEFGLPVNMTQTLQWFLLIIMVTHLPWGSTSFASFSASEFARSVLAGVTAKIRQFSLVMNCIIISLIWYSISGGWSPTGTFVIPGKSISVRFNTVWERMGESYRFLQFKRYPQGCLKDILGGCIICHLAQLYVLCMWMTPSQVRRRNSIEYQMGLLVFSIFTWLS